MNPKTEEILKELREKFGESFFDLHIRACRIVDVDENKTQEWCNKHKEDLIIEIVDFIDQIRQETKKQIISEYKKGLRCLHCGALKESNLTDMCHKCLQEI